MPSTRMRPVLVACALLASACGEADPGSPKADAGSPGPDAILTPHIPQDPRRGPIFLGFDVIDPDHDIGNFRLERLDGDAWIPAKTLAFSASPSSVEATWDSFADAPDDMRVSLRLAASDPDGDVVAPFELEVRNAPDTDRLVAVGHKLEDAPGGGARETGHGASVFVWNGLEPGVVGAPRELEVGAGPQTLRAAPHGRATAILEATDRTVSVLLTPLDALVANVTRSAPLALPYGSPTDVRWTPDGRRLLVTGASEGEQPATLWAFTPSEDLSTFGDPASLATLPGPPAAFDVDRNSGRILVFCGSGGAGKDKLLWLAPDGSELARLEDALPPPNALAISPAGDAALFTASLFGDEIRRFTLDSRAIVSAGLLTTVRSPQDVAFHPDSTAGHAAALVTQLERNRVTGLVLSESTTAGNAVAGFPLAGEVDVIQRGSQAGIALVTGVSATDGHALVQRTQLAIDGTVTAGATALDLGGGTARIPQGIAIQR